MFVIIINEESDCYFGLIIVVAAFAPPAMFHIGMAIQQAFSSRFYNSNFKLNYFSMDTIFSDEHLSDNIVEWYKKER